MATRRFEFFTGIKDELPILPGVVPFGMIYGVSALSAHIPAITAQAMSSVVFAGSSQFIIAQLVAVGTPPVIVILTAFIVNIRHMLYSASLAPFVKRLPAHWKWLLAYLLTDEAYVVTISHYRKSEDETHKHWYFLGAGLALWMTWQVSTAIGIFLGTQVPAGWSLDFTSTLTFIALVVPALKDRASTASALTAGVVAVIVYALPFKLGLGLATIIGIVVGLWVETIRHQKSTSFLRSNL
ncbi:MAG: AzlC family ABC transporter permease [Ktedonobacteraceae bacterium]